MFDSTTSLSLHSLAIASDGQIHDNHQAAKCLHAATDHALDWPLDPLLGFSSLG
jgi:hypothetical protein